MTRDVSIIVRVSTLCQSIPFIGLEGPVGIGLIFIWQARRTSYSLFNPRVLGNIIAY